MKPPVIIPAPAKPNGELTPDLEISERFPADLELRANAGYTVGPAVWTVAETGTNKYGAKIIRLRSGIDGHTIDRQLKQMGRWVPA